MKKYLILGFVFIFFSSCSTYKNTQTTYWISEVTIWNGLDSKPYKASLKIENGIIADIKKDGFLKEDLQHPVIKYPHHFVIPGLINAHVHLLHTQACAPGYGFRPSTILDNLKDFLESGFTTVADMGSWPELIGGVKKWTDKNPSLSPQVLTAGPIITLKNGYPDYWMPESAKNVKAVNYLNENNADEILKTLDETKTDYVKVALQEKTFSGKSVPILSLKALKNLSEKAHLQNKKIFVHVLTQKGIQLGLKAKVDAFIHGPHDVLDKKQINQIVDLQIPIIPTLWIWKAPWFIPENKQQYLSQYKKNVPQRILKQWDYYLNDYNGKTFPDYLVDEKNVLVSQSKKSYNQLLENINQLNNKHANLVFGTDAPYCFDLATSHYQEMLELKMAGLTNEEILKMATINAARMLGLENQIGSIEVGKKANLVLLSQNPLNDLSVLEKPSFVIHEGQRIQPYGLFSLIKIYWIFVKSIVDTFLF